MPPPVKKKAHGNKGRKPVSHRQTKYRGDYDEQARNLSMLGLTELQIAKHFNVAYSTLMLWKRRHRSFSDAIREGCIVADAVVAKSLYHRAIGYSHRATKFFQHEGTVIKEDYIEQYPPDYNAARMWLHNRQPKLWRPEKQVHDLTSTVKFETMSDEQLNRHLEQLAAKIAALQPVLGICDGAGSGGAEEETEKAVDVLPE